jgi:hypothetical protein
MGVYRYSCPKGHHIQEYGDETHPPPDILCAECGRTYPFPEPPVWKNTSVPSIPGPLQPRPPQPSEVSTETGSGPKGDS